MKDLIIRVISLLIIILVITFLISGSFSSQNIDKLAYVVALGLDVGEHNNLKMSFQISIPNNEAGPESIGSSQASNVIVNTVECSSIDAGIALINSYISKEVNLSHCKIIIFSEELASTGIAKYVYTLVNKIQIRPDANILVSRCNTEYFLKNSKPTLEKLSARYYEIAPTSTKYTGFTVDAKIGDFFSSLTDTFCQPYAILGSVNTSTTDNNKDKALPNSEKDTSYVAGETPINTNKSNIDNIGTAVFKNDVFVGELNALETICHLIINNKLKTCNITVPSPFSQNETVDLNLKFKNKTKVKLDLVNGSPYIRVKCSFDARILSIDSNSNYLDEKDLKKLSDYANSYLEESISNYLYKISKEYNADIDSFGKYAVSKFLYWQDWENYNWLDNFRNSFFSVDVNCNVKSGLILLDS